MNLTNKVVLITGASKGLGKVIADILINKECVVIGTYNNTISKEDYIDYQKCDIAKEEEIIKLFNYIKNKYNKIDVLINCAAFSDDQDYLEKSKDSFMKVIETNLVGTFLMIKNAASLMTNGTIVNVSSMDAQDSYSVYSMDYAASKAGIENLTKNFANRLPNLKICAIAPDWIDTDTVLASNKDYIETEMKRVGQKSLLKKEDVAKKVIEIIENEEYKSGEIIRMVNRYE